MGLPSFSAFSLRLSHREETGSDGRRIGGGGRGVEPFPEQPGGEGAYSFELGKVAALRNEVGCLGVPCESSPRSSSQCSLSIPRRLLRLQSEQFSQFCVVQSGPQSLLIEVNIQASKTSFASLSEGIHADCQACGKWEQEGRTIRASLHLEPDPKSASRARRFVRTALEDFEPTETLDVLTLLTSEVVTNAILYGGSEIDVVLERGEAGIRVEVADASPRLPERRPVDGETLGGRGLRLLDSLAGGWGVIELNNGKVVWF